MCLAYVEIDIAMKYNENGQTLSNISPDSDKICVKPIPQNPFMNPLITDINNTSRWATNDIKQRIEACDIENDNIKKEMNKYYLDKVYKSLDDPYFKDNGERQFYTMPNTALYNDQSGLAKWLYSKSKINNIYY